MSQRERVNLYLGTSGPHGYCATLFWNWHYCWCVFCFRGEWLLCLFISEAKLSVNHPCPVIQPPQSKLQEATALFCVGLSGSGTSPLTPNSCDCGLPLSTQAETAHFLQGKQCLRGTAPSTLPSHCCTLSLRSWAGSVSSLSKEMAIWQWLQKNISSCCGILPHGTPAEATHYLPGKWCFDRAISHASPICHCPLSPVLELKQCQTPREAVLWMPRAITHPIA